MSGARVQSVRNAIRARYNDVRELHECDAFTVDVAGCETCEATSVAAEEAVLRSVDCMLAAVEAARRMELALYHYVQEPTPRTDAALAEATTAFRRALRALEGGEVER